MNSPVIELNGVSKRFNLSSSQEDTFAGAIVHKWTSFFSKRTHTDKYQWALKDITLSVNEGEILGVIGKNGSGKSTLLRILSEIIVPTTGDVRVRGKVSSLLDVGAGFHPDLTGRENVYLNGALMGMSKREVALRFDEIVDFSGISKHIDSPVKHYSNGMFLRLGFSVASHLISDIILIDEVLSVGDTEFQYASLQKIRELTSSGKTVIIVSHGMNSILNLCTNAILLDSGKLIANDTPFNIVSKYLSGTHKKIDEKLKNEEALEFKFPHEPKDGISEIVLHEAKVLCKAKTTQEHFFIDDEISVELSLTIIKPLDDMNVMIQVSRNHESPMVVAATGLFNLYPEVSLNQKGSFKIRCSFPKYFFNKGLYSISLCLKSSVGFHLENKDVLRFFVNFRNLNLKDLWYKDAPFDVGPIASWEMNRV